MATQSLQLALWRAIQQQFSSLEREGKSKQEAHESVLSCMVSSASAAVLHSMGSRHKAQVLAAKEQGLSQTEAERAVVLRNELNILTSEGMTPAGAVQCLVTRLTSAPRTATSARQPTTTIAPITVTTTPTPIPSTTTTTTLLIPPISSSVTAQSPSPSPAPASPARHSSPPVSSSSSSGHSYSPVNGYGSDSDSDALLEKKRGGKTGSKGKKRRAPLKKQSSKKKKKKKLKKPSPVVGSERVFDF